MNPMGRQTKLTPATHRIIVNAVSTGVPLITAAQYAGVASSTVRQWLQRGEGHHDRSAGKVYVAFVDAIKKAQAADEVRRVTRLEQAARGGTVAYEKTTTYPDGRVVREVKTAEPQWTVDAWFLERSRPETWGRKERLDLRLTIETAAAKVADELGLTVEEVLVEARQLLHEVDHAES
jgi:hypothetical protein